MRENEISVRVTNSFHEDRRRGGHVQRCIDAKHPDFRVVGSDLHYDLDIAPWEAALGTSVSVPTLEEPVSIKIPAGTSSGAKLRVRGRGLKGKEISGDLIVTARIAVPRTLSPAERGLWEQLARESSFNPRD